MFCAFFKQGLCKKGEKCKFSHDPDVERKSAKRSIYVDEKSEKENDLMDDWDDEKLADVVKSKHGTEKSNQTDIVLTTSFFKKPLYNPISFVDLQIFLGRRGKQQIWLVLELSKRWQGLYVSPCSSSRIRVEKGQEEGGEKGRN